MSIFAELDLGQIQRILFPVIESLGGPDLSAEIADKGEAFQEAADVLSSASDLLSLASQATADGIIDNDEVAAIVAAAPTIQDAVGGLIDTLFGRDDDEDPA